MPLRWRKDRSSGGGAAILGFPHQSGERPVSPLGLWGGWLLVASFLIVNFGWSEPGSPATGSNPFSASEQRKVKAVDPSVRASHGLVYDSHRKRVVMFGGSGVSGSLGDTWERDDRGWMRIPVSGPSPRAGMAMAFDAARGKTVLFGGYDHVHFGDTWEWDGVSWTLIPTTGGPSPRAWHSMIYDPGIQRVVLFGGFDGMRRYNDLWQWDGATWSPLKNLSNLPPSERANQALAYDEVSSSILLFAGLTYSHILMDTWVYTNGMWVNLNAISPEFRTTHAIVTDSDRNRIVLFGGDNGSVLDDTWEWDGRDWLKMTAPGPSPRRGHAMTYDSDRKRVLLVGGWVTGSIGGIWEWDGATWTEIDPVVVPMDPSMFVLY